MGRHDRKRKPARSKQPVDSKPLILIVCEGEVTEPEYLSGFAKACRNARVTIEVEGGKGVPKTIVECAKEYKKEAEKRAKKEKDDNLKYDAIWCVFDVDTHPNIPAAINMAGDNDIELAISNPCFELWLLLHFQEQPGMQDCNKLASMIKKHLSSYSKKNKHVDYLDYSAGYDDAVKRAKQLETNAGDEEWKRNPTTGVYLLTEKIKAAS
ncbi:hypothetical protein MNBD_PLANCTO02-2826 [hydrothermal vent metagenome]|uniref:RloB-like protein n=1 Tax=hydrothermal vent metagenome TaxID=652676 RepID=A0A3B1DRW9_9ZZZZ